MTTQDLTSLSGYTNTAPPPPPPPPKPTPNAYPTSPNAYPTSPNAYLTSHNTYPLAPNTTRPFSNPHASPPPPPPPRPESPQQQQQHRSNEGYPAAPRPPSESEHWLPEVVLDKRYLSLSLPLLLAPPSLPITASCAKLTHFQHSTTNAHPLCSSP